jgi:hypothetical protein
LLSSQDVTLGVHKDVTPGFHTPSGVWMGGGVDPHKQAACML